MEVVKKWTDCILENRQAETSLLETVMNPWAFKDSWVFIFSLEIVS